MPKISPKKLPPPPAKKPDKPKLPPLEAHGFATDPKTMKEVRAHCDVLRQKGITLRMAFGCINFLINEMDRLP